MDHGIEETNWIQNMLHEWILNNEIGKTTETTGFGNKLNSKLIGLQAAATHPAAGCGHPVAARLPSPTTSSRSGLVHQKG
jgi:hypothetical protein